jgi:CRP-like cAMP-binding protein
VQIIDYLAAPATFVHIGTLCYVLGLLTRKELLLRLLLLTGSSFYILYYYTVSDNPLWEAIASSALIGSSNFPVICRIFRERSTWGMSEEMLKLYASFPNFSPGQFRRMMKIADILEPGEALPLLTQGEVPTHLYLTVDGDFELVRDGQNALIGPGNFLGEISFLLGGAATATVIACPGSRYVAWELNDLRQMMEKHAVMDGAIAVLLNKDVARKLAVSFPSLTRPTAAQPAAGTPV